jgi:hypothetical protein
MKTSSFYPLLLSLFLFIGCAKKEVVPIKSLIIGDPLECGISEMLLFPVGTSSFQLKKRNQFEGQDVKGQRKNILYFSENSSLLNDRLAKVEYVNENLNNFDIRNILFYNMVTGKSNPLCLDTFHILSFAIHDEFDTPLIFYRIVKNDYNEDKKFNSSDPIMLYISEISGDNLVAITSEDEQFIDYFYYPAVQKILIKTIIDSDGNREFEQSDETNFLEMLIQKPGIAKGIFSKNLRDSLRMEIISED